jgi:hypothetical protein
LLPAAKLVVRTEQFGSAEPCFSSLCCTERADEWAKQSLWNNEI